MLFSTRAEFLLNTVRVQVEYIKAIPLLSVAKLLKKYENWGLISICHHTQAHTCIICGIRKTS